MNIPSEIKIGGKLIKVELVEKLSKNIAFWKGNDYVIKVEDNDKYPRQRRDEAFMHEIIEAINSIYELKLKHWKINILGEALYQILNENDLSKGE